MVGVSLTCLVVNSFERTVVLDEIGTQNAHIFSSMSTTADLSPSDITIRPSQRPSINHLPVELLSHISCLAILRYNDGDMGFPQLDFARRVLCGVSSLWRSIVVSLPELWTTIVNFANIPYHWSTVENWIPLSHNLPLDLAIPHFPRLRRLHVDVHFSSSLPSIENHFVSMVYAFSRLVDLAM